MAATILLLAEIRWAHTSMSKLRDSQVVYIIHLARGTGRGGTGKAGQWAKRDTEVIMMSQLKLARADKKLSAT